MRSCTWPLSCTPPSIRSLRPSRLRWPRGVAPPLLANCPSLSSTPRSASLEARGATRYSKCSTVGLVGEKRIQATGGRRATARAPLNMRRSGCQNDKNNICLGNSALLNESQSAGNPGTRRQTDFIFLPNDSPVLAWGRSSLCLRPALLTSAASELALIKMTVSLKRAL